MHGHQEGRFFHGYYDCFCYLPLYVFCGRHLLAAKLRRSNIDAAAGAAEEIARIVAQIRERWPRVRILLRADSGFTREPLMAWCEANRVDYLFGLARNDRLVAEIEGELALAAKESVRTGKPARRFRDFSWCTLDSWSRYRRVVGKAEWTGGEANPRFIVTSLKPADVIARPLYETIYCLSTRRFTASLRDDLLRPWRHGEPHQGMPARSVRRSYIGDDNARKPAEAVVRVDGLRAGLRTAPDRPQPHPVRSGDLQHDPAQAPEDRSPGTHQCPPCQSRNGLGVPLPA
jgi:Transposase DDE domain group 1